MYVAPLSIQAVYACDLSLIFALHADYANPFANYRVAADFDALLNVSAYETYTPCDTPACKSMSVWRWRPAAYNNTEGWRGFGPAEERTAIHNRMLNTANAHYQVIDVETQQPMLGGLARGSVNWNAFLKKYILIADKGMHGGASRESNYGEIWYCEATAITGPWRECVRVISHAGTGTSCYNPLQLQFMDELGGQVVRNQLRKQFSNSITCLIQRFLWCSKISHARWL
eukprot:SAG31_NODE_2876_length_4970_cov_2.820776_4_plen_229_part_00